MSISLLPGFIGISMATGWPLSFVSQPGFPQAIGPDGQKPTSGIAKCWGLNIFGQLRNGTFTTSQIPVDVSNFGALVQAIMNHNLGNSSCEIMKP